MAKAQNRDDFKPNTVQRLGERAGYICSNPSCSRLTIGPDLKDSELSNKTGRACHITAASPDGPRYDMSLTKDQRTHIDNGIWLCATCSDLIDKNDGGGYPVAHLRRWKKDHETLVKDCLEGKRRLALNWLIDRSDTATANKVIKFLEQRGALFMPYQYEVTPHVIDSIKEIRVFLTAIASDVSPESGLSIIVDSLNHACRHFMNTSSPNATPQELQFGLGALRKIFAINIADLSKIYELKVKGPLVDALPRT